MGSSRIAVESARVEVSADKAEIEMKLTLVMAWASSPIKDAGGRIVLGTWIMMCSPMQ